MYALKNVLPISYDWAKILAPTDPSLPRNDFSQIRTTSSLAQREGLHQKWSWLLNTDTHRQKDTHMHTQDRRNKPLAGFNGYNLFRNMLDDFLASVVDVQARKGMAWDFQKLHQYHFSHGWLPLIYCYPCLATGWLEPRAEWHMCPRRIGSKPVTG